MSECVYLDFFMGANTPAGFISRFGGLCDRQLGERLWVIKGGPGTGKSTLMKTIAAGMESRCRRIDRIHCSSDCGSLDAVVFPEYGLAVVDGTPPHAIEPTYPGAFENVVSLCGCWDKDALYLRRMEIISLADHISERHRECVSLLRASYRLLDEGRRLTEDSVDSALISRWVSSFVRRELPAPTGARGRETPRMLSAVTDVGPVYFSDSAAALAPRLWLIEDPWGEVSGELLSLLREKALENGVDAVVSMSPIFPCDRIDGVLFPSVGVGVVTGGALFSPEFPGSRTIHAGRFIPSPVLKDCRNRLNFLQKTAVSLAEQAGVRIAEAKAAHDRLEAIYSAAMDFSAVRQVTEATLDELLRASGGVLEAPPPEQNTCNGE